MSENSTETDPVTFEVVRAERRFPMLSGARHSPPRNRIRELQVQAIDEALPGRLAQSISQQLAWRKIQIAATPDRETVVGAYVNSLKKLSVYRIDVERLVFEACRANLEFRQGTSEIHTEAKDAILKSKLDQMMAQAFVAWTPAKNIVNADLLSHPLDYYLPQLGTSLSNEVANFSQQMFDMLKYTVDLELFGLVEWMPKQCCRYHFFRRVVIQGAAETNQASTDTFTDDNDGSFDTDRGRRVVGNRRTTATQSVKHEIRFARHQHELINAVRTSIRNSTVIMPPQIVRLVQSIPEWLYPYVEVIDGQIVRELIVERDLAVEDWTKVDVRDEPIIDVDPGIVIGPYVLSGWGSVEIRKERERLQSIEHAATLQVNERLAPVLIVAAMGLSVIAIWLEYRWMQGYGGFLFVILAPATAVVATWQAFSDHATCHRFATPQIYAHLMTLSMALVLLCAEWTIARMFNSLSWLTPVILSGVSFLCYHAARLFR